MGIPTGTHVHAWFLGCTCPDPLLRYPQALLKVVQTVLDQVGVGSLDSLSNTFPNESGVTVLVLLAESHLAIHTWPESDRSVLIDLSMCDCTRSNRERALSILDRLRLAFFPMVSHIEEADYRPKLTEPAIIGAAPVMTIEEILRDEEFHSTRIRIAEVAGHGLTLLLNDTPITCVNHEFYVNEPLIHLPLLTLKRRERVLLIGAGDGSAAQQVLKDCEVQNCTILERNQLLVRMAQEELSALHHDCFTDQRVTALTGEYLRLITGDASEYDLIVLTDLNRAVESADSVCYRPEFMDILRSRLRSTGRLAGCLGAPLDSPLATAVRYAVVRARFPDLTLYQAFSPLHRALLLFFITGCDLPSQDEMARRMSERGLTGLQILTPETYSSMLSSVPPSMQQMLNRAGKNSSSLLLIDAIDATAQHTEEGN